MVSASRRHLTERYATGVDRLLWDTEKRLIPDPEGTPMLFFGRKKRLIDYASCAG